MWRVMTLERKFSTKKGAANGTTDLTKKLGFSEEKNVRKEGKMGRGMCYIGGEYFTVWTQKHEELSLYCWYSGI